MRVKKITDHEIQITINTSIEWDVSNDHCEESDPYEIRKPVSAAYSVGNGEVAYFYFEDAEDNLVEEAITNAIQNGEITNDQ